MKTSKDFVTIWVTFRKEGLHQYPAALKSPELESVHWLGFVHRHIFHFRVEIQVFDNDREIEFIMFKRELEGLFDKQTSNKAPALELNNKSCEMIAVDLIDWIAAKYPRRAIKVEVAEDGENGATVSRKIQ